MTKLYRFQREDVRNIERFGGRVLLASEMGTGKTAQAIMWSLWYLPADARILVICPASIKINWQREWLKFGNVRTEIISGMKPTSLPDSRILIVNYDILAVRKGQQSSWLGLLDDWKPDLIICDECHYVKSPSAKRSKAVRMLCKNAPHVIMVSGTPMTNRPAELFSCLQILCPEEFPSWTKYLWRYCNPRLTPWGLDVSGASNLMELHERLTELCMIRRRKVDVLKDLPPKIHSVIPIELTGKDRKEYDTAEREFVQWLRRVSPERARTAEKAEYLVKHGYLRRLAGVLKQKSVIEWIENFLQDTDEKLIFFGVHKKFLRPIYEKFKETAVIVDGSVTNKKRQTAFDSFVNLRKKRLFIGNIVAAGLGWNGQVACNVAFGELPETPGELNQASDRAHRIGQSKVVTCYYLVSEDTIEEKLCDLLQSKQEVLSRTLDGEKRRQSLNIYSKLDEALLSKYGKKRKR
jgi:SWI/SNF-related matrix-associated actin-dependent regulator 1 of chromatin subfamily A